MKLYHGSTVTVKSPNIQKGRKATDFGKGFYTTTNFEQAKKWAILKRNREHGKKAVVSVYEVPDNILDREFSVLRFDGAISMAAVCPSISLARSYFLLRLTMELHSL